MTGLRRIFEDNTPPRPWFAPGPRDVPGTVAGRPPESAPAGLGPDPGRPRDIPERARDDRRTNPGRRRTNPGRPRDRMDLEELQRRLVRHQRLDGVEDRVDRAVALRLLGDALSVDVELHGRPLRPAGPGHHGKRDQR